MPHQSKRQKRDAPESDDNESINSDDIPSDSEIEDAPEEQVMISAEEKRLLLAQEYIEKLGLDYKGDDVNAVARSLGITNNERERTRILSDHITIEDDSDFIRFKNDTLTCVEVSYDDKYFFVGTKKGHIYSVDSFTLAKSKFPDVHSGAVNSVCLAMNGKLLISGGYDGQLYVWDVNSYANGPISILVNGTKKILALAAFNDIVYVGSADKCLSTWNIPHQHRLHLDHGHTAPILSIDCITQNLVLTGGEDESVRYWNIEHRKHAAMLSNGYVDAVGIMSKHAFLSGGNDKNVSLFSISRKKAIQSFEMRGERSNWVTAIAVVPNSDVAFVGSDTGYIYVLKASIADGGALEQINSIPTEGILNALKVSRSGRLLLCAIGRENRLGKWNTWKTKDVGLRVFRLEHQFHNKLFV